ncbi:MAG: helix-turn-helix domain-containing protein [Hyphomicrobiaceae bacterium]
MLRLTEAVALLKGAGIDLSAEYLRRRVISGEIKGRILGRSWRIAESDLLEFVNRSAKPQEQPQPVPREQRSTGHKDNGLIIEGIDYEALRKYQEKRNKKRR